MSGRSSSFASIFAALLAATVFAGCAGSPEEIPRLELSPTRIEAWEDGSTLVIVFMTKDLTRARAPLSPVVTFSLDRPAGDRVERAVAARAADYAAAKDRCDVRIAACTASGDLRDYVVHFEDDDVVADLRLAGTVPSWRPGTGYAFFDARRYFAWLPSVPRGTVEGTLTIGGAERRVTGVGYHDHNWGNAALPALVHHWYWGRANVGAYTLIASDITATDRYGGLARPVFMLARDGDIVADDSSKVRFSTDEVFTESFTGKPVAGRLVYDYEDGAVRYRITFRRMADIARTRFVDLLKGVPRLLARVAGFDGAYLRFRGTVTVERFEGGQLAETASQDSAVWELMYFGRS